MCIRDSLIIERVLSAVELPGSFDSGNIPESDPGKKEEEVYTDKYLCPLLYINRSTGRYALYFPLTYQRYPEFCQDGYGIEGD